jgi:type I restriction enzyme S subunit
MREGWEIKKMSEVYDVRDGTHDSPKYQDEGYPLITSKNLKDGIVTFDKIKYISEEDYIEINKRSKVDIGDVLFAMIGTIGNPTVIVDEPRYAIKNVALFKVNSTENSQYLKYYLESQSVIDKMLKDAKGSTQSFVGLGYLRQFPIPIPPIKEQQQIVSILDQAFEAIDQAKANIEKNIANAKELFQSKLNAIFSQKGDGWEEKSLPELVNNSCSLSYGIVQPGEEYSDGLLVVRPTDMKNKFININELKRINPAKSDAYKRTILTGNELLLCVRGDTGVVSISNRELKGANVTRGIVPILFNESSVRLDFGYYQFISETLFKQIKEKTYGAALMQINIRDVRQLKLNIPPIKIQDEILPKLNSLSNNAEFILSLYNQKLKDLEDLKKSILQKAFAGALTNKEESVHLKQVAEPEARYSKK